MRWLGWAIVLGAGRVFTGAFGASVAAKATVIGRLRVRPIGRRGRHDVDLPHGAGRTQNQKRRERVDSEDFEGIRSVVRDFVRTTVVPVENDIDEHDEVPVEIREAAKKMGLFGFALPEEYGGLGLSMEEEGRGVIELGDPPRA